MKNGLNKERDLVNYLEYKGLPSVRVAGSGGGTRKDKPDIISFDKGKAYAIELKSSSNDSIYISEEQIKELYRFAERAGIIPVIAIKFTYLPYCFMTSRDLKVVGDGNYRIDREKASKFKNKLVLTG